MGPITFEMRARRGIPDVAKRLCEHPEVIESLLWECHHAEVLRFLKNGQAYWKGNGASLIPGDDLDFDF